MLMIHHILRSSGSSRVLLQHMSSSTDYTLIHRCVLSTTSSYSYQDFKNVPVIPSILHHIESLGVGMRKRPKRRKRQKAKGSGGDVMNAKEEQEFLTKQTENKNLSSTQKHNSLVPPIPFGMNNQIYYVHGSSDEGKTKVKLRRNPVKLLGAVGSENDEFPASSLDFPEIALAGRSNVGKSTLLNALLYGNMVDFTEQMNELAETGGRRQRRSRVTKLPKGLKAVTSDKPGETREISFYKLEASVECDGDNTDSQSLGLLLVDFPGYGFSFAKEESVVQWRHLMKKYIRNRSSLKRILLLIDSRHGFKNADIEFLEYVQDAMVEGELGNNTSSKSKITLPPVQIVLTKCDLVKQADLAKRVLTVQDQLSETLKRVPSNLPVMLVSAKPGVGFNNFYNGRLQGGILEMQRELASLVPK